MTPTEMLENATEHFLAQRLVAALEMVTSLLKLEPENLNAMLLCGRIMRRGGKLEEAVALYKTIIAHVPDNAEAFGGLGAAYGNMKRYGDAEKALRHAVMLNARYYEAWTFLAEALVEQGKTAEAIDSLAEIYKQWVPEEKILRTNLWSSELSKLTANAFLAQRISSINSVAALCEATGADVREVAKAIGTDSRIGPKFLSAGPGFGGSCFQKDILNLVYLCRHFGLPDVAEYWESVVLLNTWQQHRIARLVVQKLFGTVTGKRLAVLGFAFKADTNDTREAPAIRICRDLLEEGAQLAIHDPKVDPEQISRDLKLIASSEPQADAGPTRGALSGEATWWPSTDVASALQGADAVLILTEWQQYRELDWAALAPLMRKPAWVFDARGVVDPKQVQSAGLNVWRVGEGDA